MPYVSSVSAHLILTVAPQATPNIMVPSFPSQGGYVTSLQGFQGSFEWRLALPGPGPPPSLGSCPSA